MKVRKAPKIKQLVVYNDELIGLGYDGNIYRLMGEYNTPYWQKRTIDFIYDPIKNDHK